MEQSVLSGYISPVRQKFKQLSGRTKVEMSHVMLEFLDIGALHDGTRYDYHGECFIRGADISYHFPAAGYDGMLIFLAGLGLCFQNQMVHKS